MIRWHRRCPAHPLSAHDMMRNVFANAVNGDPYRLDTLMLPLLVVCDAFQSETVAFADLVLPDTTCLERHDVMSMLDPLMPEREIRPANQYLPRAINRTIGDTISQALAEHAVGGAAVGGSAR